MDDSVVACVGVAKRMFFPDGRAKEIHLLKTWRALRPATGPAKAPARKRRLRKSLLVGVVEAADQLKKGAFAAAACADEGDPFSRADLKIKAVDHHQAGPVAEVRLSKARRP